MALILLIIAALVLDTLSGYLRICVRRSATYAPGLPPEVLFRTIDVDLPQMFRRPAWMAPAVTFGALLLGVVLLFYGILLYGLMIGLVVRMIPWGLGRLLARMFDRTVNPSLK